MKVTFLGAAHTVTGSCYMLEANNARFIVDCGMHQGNAEIEKRNLTADENLKPGVDFVLLTHAHIDHSGLLPRLAKDGFKGPIYCTLPTHDLLDIMLLDSAHIQEMEAEWLSRRQTRKGAKPVEPLYTQADALEATKLLRDVKYGESFAPASGIKVTYRDAGHILGSAFLEIEVTEPEGTTRLLFSGDLGRRQALIVNDPDIPEMKVDYLFTESTYGDRDHRTVGDSRTELYEAISRSHGLGGKVIIPAFAVERTQEIIYTLYLLGQEGKLPPDMPIFVDSPMAVAATEVFRKHPEYYDEELAAIAKAGGDPFSLPNLRYTRSLEDSRAINSQSGPAIIISASGMCNAGRIKHHLRHNIWKSSTSIVFVGYQGVGTPGRKIVDGAKNIRLLGEDLAVAAKIYTIGGFSAHAGQSQILEWIGRFAHPAMKVFLVHGEQKALDAMRKLLKERFGLEADTPNYLEEVTLAPGKDVITQFDIQRSQPRVNWNFLFSDTKTRFEQLQDKLNHIDSLPWEEQVELRDLLHEVNSDLLRILTRI